MIARRILVVLLFGALFGAGWWVGRGRAESARYAAADLFLEVLHEVDLNYVDPVEPERLVHGAVRGMLRDLDVHARFVPEGVAPDPSAGAGVAEAVGLVIDLRGHWPTVIAPIEDSPAWDAGLRAGDVITRIGERSPFGLGLAEVIERLEGADDTTVEITVSRANEPDLRDLALTRRQLRRRTQPDVFAAPGGVAVARLTGFGEHTRDQLRGGLDSLRRLGARRLVLDLRGNARGSLEAAVAVAGAFLPPGSVVVESRGRDSSHSRVTRAADPAPILDWPMAVLVDRGTAGGAEVVAGALQDLDRALLVGEPTFGRASIQAPFTLRGDHGTVWLTVTRQRTPSGRVIDRRPVPVPVVGEDDGDVDTAPTDSAPPMSYRTRSGRTIAGGGGIHPDILVASDTAATRPRTVAERRSAVLADAAFRAAIERLGAARAPADVWTARAEAR